MDAEATIKTEGNVIFATGRLDENGADSIVGAMSSDSVVYVLDFGGVESISFAALRALLRARRSGNRRFCVVNANQDVAERFEDTGVSMFVNVCRKPKPLRLGQYDEFGAGFLSKAFNSEDGDSMMKVYGKRVPKWMVAQEKTVARAVMAFGIPTPLVGTLYEDGENTGLDFERIKGKRSFSRIISEEPDRMEEISRRFARMCKQLHSTDCDTNIFSDRKNHYRRAFDGCASLSNDLKARALAFLDGVPDATTCLHGDMQMSNAITNETDDLWIDLADFSYGNPMFDMGMWYFLARLIPEFRSMDIFHLTSAQMKQVWDIFVDEYFDARTDEAKNEVERRVQPFAALHMLYLGVTYGFEDGMLEFINDKLPG